MAKMTDAEKLAAIDAACDEYERHIKKKELHGGIAAHRLYVEVRKAVGGEIVP